MSNNVVLCLDTLGSTPNSVILSIGAVAFGEATNPPPFYEIISGASCLTMGLVIDFRSLCWWVDQPDESRALINKADRGAALSDALQSLTDAFDWHDAIVWGGETYYNTLSTLEHAYRVVGKVVPWNYYNARCYQTWQAAMTREHYNSFALTDNAHPSTALTRAQALADTMVAARQTCSRRIA